MLVNLESQLVQMPSHEEYRPEWIVLLSAPRVCSNRIGAALGDEAVRHVAIAIEPLGLKVRSVRSADQRAFVPVEAEPAQAVENAFDHRRGRPFGVGILNSQHEGAAMAPCEEPIEQRRAGAADVEVAGRRRSEADANHGPTLLSPILPRYPLDSAVPQW